ncbi:MAG: hypothetical protein ACOYL6_11475 [Bacteriovoracaceae bacterium]
MKKKNPLYVVTNKGKDVEQASNLIDGIIKKLNLAPVIEILKVFLKMLSENVKSYAMFVEVKKVFDQYLAMLAPLFAMFSKTTQA